LVASAAVFSLALLGGQQAFADPLSDAQKKLAKLDAQTSALEDAYNASKQRLSDAQNQQSQLSSDIAAQQSELDALRPSIVWIVTMQRQSTGINMTATFLLDDTEEGFLSQMSTVATVTNVIDEQVARYVSEQQRLADLQSSLGGTLDTIKAEVATQKSLLADAQQKQNQQQAIINRLTAQQQAALAAQNNPNPKVDPVPVIDQGQASDRAMIVVAYALKQVGKRYVWGTAGPNTFDCSGLAMAAYAKVGIALPHGARPQANYGKKVARNALLPGDLLFFYSPISHVTIYIGNGKMVSASGVRTGIRIESIGPSFNTARRLV